MIKYGLIFSNPCNDRLSTIFNERQIHFSYFLKSELFPPRISQHSAAGGKLINLSRFYSVFCEKSLQPSSQKDSSMFSHLQLYDIVYIF